MKPLAFGQTRISDFLNDTLIRREDQFALIGQGLKPLGRKLILRRNIFSRDDYEI